MGSIKIARLLEDPDFGLQLTLVTGAEGLGRVITSSRIQKPGLALAGFTEHLGRLGAAVAKTVELYNAALGSFDARVLPHARRLREAGAAGRKELVALVPVEERPRDPRGEPADVMGPT